MKLNLRSMLPAHVMVVTRSPHHRGTFSHLGNSVLRSSSSPIEGRQVAGVGSKSNTLNPFLVGKKIKNQKSLDKQVVGQNPYLIAGGCNSPTVGVSMRTHQLKANKRTGERSIASFFWGKRFGESEDFNFCWSMSNFSNPQIRAHVIVWWSRRLFTPTPAPKSQVRSGDEQLQRCGAGQLWSSQLRVKGVHRHESRSSADGFPLSFLVHFFWTKYVVVIPGLCKHGGDYPLIAAG